MKPLHLLVGIFIFSTFALAAPREVKFHTKKIGENIHWMPSKAEVTEGETVTFIATHDEPGGFDFHGFKIEALGIEGTADRTTPFKKDVEITLKPGTYDIGCQFHPKHQHAKLIVKKAKVKPAAKTAPGKTEEPVSPIRK